jgi:orotate phosphoribosyltransferase
MAKSNDFLNLFKKLEAIQSGHFILTSGKHSDTYVQCARILENPSVTAKLCKILSAPWNKSKIDVVVGPAVGGIVIAYELARALKARAVYMERMENKLTLRRGFSINKGENVLVVEDVVTTGGSAQEVMNVVKELGANVKGVVSLVDRSGNMKSIFPVKTNSILKVQPILYTPEDCPLCREGLPAITPGSRGLKK